MTSVTQQLVQPVQLHPFVELFQINRLIKNVVIPTAYSKYAQDLSTKNKKQHEILTMLYDDGIKMYMCKHYNDSQCDNIRLLYLLSSQTFPKEWSTLLSLHKDKMKNKQLQTDKFWSCQDVLMCSFQYLDFLSLNCCSLVCCNFLFTAFNPNSVYCLNLNDNVDKQMLDHINDMNLRGWKRLSNVKHLNLDIRFLTLKFKEKVDQFEDKIDESLWVKSLADITRKFRSAVTIATKEEAHICLSSNFINGFLSIRSIRILSLVFKKYDPNIINFMLKLADSDMISTTNNIKKFSFQVLDTINNIDRYCTGNAKILIQNCQLKLLNCEECVLYNAHFQVALSKQCKYIKLGYQCFINILSAVRNDDMPSDISNEIAEQFKQWRLSLPELAIADTPLFTKYLKSNLVSDLHKIERVELKQIEFVDISTLDSRKVEKVKFIKTICDKMCNVKRLKVCGGLTNDTYCVWKQLIPIVLKNNGKICIDNLTNNSTQISSKLVAHDVLIHWNKIKDVAVFKKFLIHELRMDTVETISLILDTPEVFSTLDDASVDNIHFDDLLNVFFYISTVSDGSREISPHPLFSKLDSKEKFNQHGVSIGGVNNTACVGYRVMTEHDNGEMGKEICEKIVKVEVLMINEQRKQIFLHYNAYVFLPDETVCTRGSAGGYHKLPNDNLYPASFVGRRKRRGRSFLTRRPTLKWHDEIENLKCISIREKGKLEEKVCSKFVAVVTGQKLIQVMSFIIDINQRRINKNIKSSISNECRSFMIGLDIDVHSNMFDKSRTCTLNADDIDIDNKHDKMILNVFQTVEKLILKSIPINIKIRGIIKHNQQSRILCKEYQRIFESVFKFIKQNNNENGNLYKAPKCCNEYWIALNTFTITFTKGQVFDKNGEMHQSICAQIQTASRV